MSCWQKLDELWQVLLSCWQELDKLLAGVGQVRARRVAGVG
jgi:hypothetical protein